MIKRRHHIQKSATCARTRLWRMLRARPAPVARATVPAPRLLRHLLAQECPDIRSSHDG